jgi:hypothetical protein
MTALLGVLVGAMIAALAQLWVRRSQTRERWLGELLKHCADIYALESAFRGIAYDAVHGGDKPNARGWSVERRRTAEANIFLLTDDPALTRSLALLRDAGRAMHHAVGTDAFEAKAEVHQRELGSFAAAARKALRGRRVI